MFHRHFPRFSFTFLFRFSSEPNTHKSNRPNSSDLGKNGVRKKDSMFFRNLGKFPFWILVTLCFFLGCTGTRPMTLGLQNGKLGLCPETPNCVSSFCLESDSEHFIKPLSFSGKPEEAKARLKAILAETPRTNIIKEEDKYLYVEFTSFLWRFVDDVEFLIDPNASVIHVRSASRLGKSDLGVNRKRIEKIRSAFSP